MSELRSAVAGILAVGVGVVTLRRLRRYRRATPRDQAKSEATKAMAEAREAAEHATAASEHARVAAEKAVEYARDELERSGIGREEERTPAEPSGRIRKVGKGWIRR